MSTFSFSRRTEPLPRASPGFPCSKCHAKTRVTDSRNFGENVRRARRCISCGHTFFTEEVEEDQLFKSEDRILARVKPLIRALLPLLISLVETEQ